MKRRFTSFPTGWPGLALLLARSGLALTFLFECWNRPALLSPSLWNGLVVVLSLCLGAGLMTPIVAVACALIELHHLWADADLLTAFVAAQCLATAVLGAGAYSIDGQRHGRKVIVWPPR